jgi:hypothetical protein
MVVPLPNIEALILKRYGGSDNVVGEGLAAR